MATLKQNSESLKAVTNKLKNLPKRAVLTDLVVTKNGDYTPEDENSGFKRVSVNVPSEIDALIDRSITGVNSGVTSIGSSVFSNCKALTSVNFPNATSVGSSAFNYCKALTSADFPKVTSIDQYAFQECSELTSADFPKVTSIGDSAFKYCRKLISANFPIATSIGRTALYYCNQLTSVNIPNVESISKEMFYCCYVLPSVDLPKVTSIDTDAFTSCNMLKSVILRSETLCTLSHTNAFNSCYHILGTRNNTYNPNGDKDGYIYVPKALLSDDDETMDYRRATNWSEFASQFRALEDYTVDGTVTGELDSNKI